MLYISKRPFKVISSDETVYKVPYSVLLVQNTGLEQVQVIALIRSLKKMILIITGQQSIVFALSVRTKFMNHSSA